VSKGSVVVAENESRQRISDGWQCIGYRVYNEKGRAPKKIARVLMFFVIPDPSPSPSSPGGRKFIFFVIPFDLLRKKRTMMQNGKVNLGKDGQDGEKERVTLHLSLKVAV
jgi:hypothetical protein